LFLLLVKTFTLEPSSKSFSVNRFPTNPVAPEMAIVSGASRSFFLALALTFIFIALPFLVPLPGVGTVDDVPECLQYLLDNFPSPRRRAAVKAAPPAAESCDDEDVEACMCLSIFSSSLLLLFVSSFVYRARAYVCCE